MQYTDDIIFESRDVEIFNIPETKTKLNTLQNYFFPRLQRLLDTAIQLVRDVYKVDPFEKYTIVYRPAHRKNSDDNWDSNIVHIGIAGRRKLDRKLRIRKTDGSNYVLQPSYLLFKIFPTGEIFVKLSPFYLNYDKAYIQRIKRCLAKNYNQFSVLLNAGKIFYEDEKSFIALNSKLKDQYSFRFWLTGWFRDEHPFNLSSAKHYFPIINQKAIQDLIRTFVFMYPVLDACHDIAEDKAPAFKAHFQRLKDWMINAKRAEKERTISNDTILEFPELDSYKFVRAGLWYQVLARDNWTCLSCGRSAKEHGIILHVDHILPRSLGGKDEIENLQTLCLKCNIGKSNKDSTDLKR